MKKQNIITAATIKSKRVTETQNHNLIILPTTITDHVVTDSVCAIVTLTNEDGLPP